eukprot:CAMPEP_0181238674 /NCGR_PEP_ID=MMETSP1096-20121128/39486_1 /TAXON_ID=156174 ORGANISM="Chrysochromulina ericina, Strain CCMP281" /NCGR_SAMPLE_ID=MMETSP1096 /ASSEMBLY_ACC=CAM_ASM_000453 /LENGTH=147 /DNA_ID=CAMNT_0023334239 /DNA_START=543 /DNA_END=987 /DNA_ORIENTATION=-
MIDLPHTLNSSWRTLPDGSRSDHIRCWARRAVDDGVSQVLPNMSELTNVDATAAGSPPVGSPILASRPTVSTGVNGDSPPPLLEEFEEFEEFPLALPNPIEASPMRSAPPPCVNMSRVNVSRVNVRVAAAADSLAALPPTLPLAPAL